MTTNEHNKQKPYGRFFFGAQKELITHVKNYFCDVSFSKPSPRSESWENGVPRIGPRTSTALFALVWKPLHDLNL